MRPIDADALVQSICQDQCDYMKETCDSDCEMIAYITNAPTVDAVPVVRCKDCKHCYYADNRISAERTDTCEKTGANVAANWFCADGESREEE